MIEFLKFLLFIRQQLPNKYDELTKLIEKYDGKPGLTGLEKLILRRSKKFVERSETVFADLSHLIETHLEHTKGFLVMFGTSTLNPKEIYFFKTNSLICEQNNTEQKNDINEPNTLTNVIDVDNLQIEKNELLNLGLFIQL